MDYIKEYSKSLIRYLGLGFSLDTSMIRCGEECENAQLVDKAVWDRKRLEAGEKVNMDELRMVGHYWLRNPSLAPNEEIRERILAPLQQLKKFAARVDGGELRAPAGEVFDTLLIIGIGGSALGPQFVTQAMQHEVKRDTYFMDNTDPQGLNFLLEKIGEKLSSTLVVVISKSGRTVETRNAMLEVKARYEGQRREFGRHACAITGAGSDLDDYAIREGFLARFPMEDWVGGRTSITSVVGLVPMALQGIEVDRFLEGAAAMDARTRSDEVANNAAMQLALAWYHEGEGKGEKDMVVLPYKDSLSLISKYLQQLVMESLGKEKNIRGEVVHQGLSVYGNKGSTDQHAYIQQLRDGVKNCFATFIEVRKGRGVVEVEPEITSAHFLQGFLRGTRKALFASGRHSVTITIEEVDAFNVGMLIALFERSVSYYASFIEVNPYHQPGVEAGKLAAQEFIQLLIQVRQNLPEKGVTAQELSAQLEVEVEEVYHVLNHLESQEELVVNRGTEPYLDCFSRP